MYNRKKMKKIKTPYKYIVFYILVFFFINFFPQINIAKVSNKNAVKTLWKKAAVIAGAAKYFIRTEKIEKKAASLNNHPINIPPQILRRMLRQLTYRYDREHPEIPLFSEKELGLLEKWVPIALQFARPNEDVTFVIKGRHRSARWAGKEERLTSGRIFVSNNQLNIILGTVQANLQPTLDERYQGNVWETTKVIYDLGYRKKIADYEGLIVIFDQKQKGIYRKSSKRKDWFVFTNLAYQQAKDPGENKEVSREQYRSLQQQIDLLQKNLNKQQKTPPQRLQKRSKELNNSQKQSRNISAQEKQMIIEQRLKTIEKLYKKRILSEEEYRKKRQEILSDM